MIESRRAFQIYTAENLNERYMYSCLPKHCLNFVLFLVLYLSTALFEMKSSLIALGSNLLVNLNICKAIRWITTFGNGNMLSSLNKGSVCAKYGENVIIRMTFFCNLINGSICVSGVLPQTSTQ